MLVLPYRFDDFGSLIVLVLKKIKHMITLGNNRRHKFLMMARSLLALQVAIIKGGPPDSDVLQLPVWTVMDYFACIWMLKKGRRQLARQLESRGQIKF